MDHPTSPSPIDRPAKRQCRVSQAPEDEPKLENQPQQVTNGTTIEPKIPVRTRGTLTAEFMKVVNLNDSLATPALKLLDFSAMNKLQYSGSASERFRLFVMVSFQPWKRPIFKPTPSMSLSLDRDSMW
ncbi:hypothetical protein PCH_Pc21g00100 [Penicillium rubens Wisconsin 54-1255]|uniref:Uncharacterized protein n=1 Tax=Penicillium rubens (strain ATCC 28089 / DSM 1075 / NRRL 1951 / Wisconsin 54-1255) TaxID=500485 RepID=B6HN21_PENRW|nr:hypothetical protein PCH_Pc21g00100 [Penicillium rubens Wisconsin 54-1255]